MVLFGLALAAMNTAFYSSLAYLPIGVAVTVEFLGPLTLAAVLSRRPRDVAAVLAAGLGVALVSGATDATWGRFEPIGLLWAAVAGAMWAAYIVLSQRTGTLFNGLDGLALALVVLDRRRRAVRALLGRQVDAARSWVSASASPC